MTSHEQWRLSSIFVSKLRLVVGLTTILKTGGLRVGGLKLGRHGQGVNSCWSREVWREFYAQGKFASGANTNWHRGLAS